MSQMGVSAKAQREGREARWRPLGKGYEGFPDFLRGYCARDGNPAGNPDLSMSLGAFVVPEARGILRKLSPHPICLIQGITCPANGVTLSRYLAELGVARPCIYAIDIMDVPEVARAAGYDGLPELHFEVADASDLREWPNQSVNLLIQDHLLNCAPHSIHEAIVREAARILAPPGLLILNFSVEARLADLRAIGWANAERVLATHLINGAYCLRDAAAGRNFDALKEAFVGRLISDRKTGRQIMVTAPYGNFEFYFRAASLERLLTRYGLAFAFQARSDGVDGNGVACTRYRTLVWKEGAPDLEGNPDLRYTAP